ncbi:hypothetical protein DTW90_33385 [Neorhizobium sp. P12A]|nr:hypothetical protein DTW90_33385 [Neorhizobium sp. P12A]
MDRIAGTATDVASGATSVAKSEVRTFVKSVEDKIRERPILAGMMVVDGDERRYFFRLRKVEPSNPEVSV